MLLFLNENRKTEMQLCNCNFTTFMRSIKHTPHLLTVPPHLSHTARKSTGQLGQGRVSCRASRQNKTNHAISRQTAPAVHQKSVPLLSLRYFRSTKQLKSVLLYRARLNVPLHRVRKEKSSS